jgi:predicted acetyltransferase
MSTEIHPIPDHDIAQFAQIVLGAYPSTSAPPAEMAERLRRGRVENPATELYGLYRDGALLGGMRLFDYTMLFHGIAVPVGGVGLVAVDLLHKKEHVARDMLRFYLRRYRAAGAPLAALYPFRPDFYRQMGFGYGTKLSHYRVRPADLPHHGARSHLRELSAADMPAFLACYQRYAQQTHGLFLRAEVEARRFFEGAGRVLGYVDGDAVQGYLAYGFRPGPSGAFIDNDIDVRELVYEHPAALAELLGFLHSQADQIARVIFNIQDDQLHQLLHDPRGGDGRLFPSVYHETNAQAVGIMYRALDLPGLFAALAEHDFGGQSLVLGLRLHDSFLPENDGETLLRFRDGRVSRDDSAPPDVRLSLSVGIFSSLLMGAVDFTSLQRYGLAEIDDRNYSGSVSRLFFSPARPICLTPF